MSRSTPLGTCAVNIESLGLLQGLEYPGGVRQFCGIPYADLSKRWTRSTLKTSWENGCHDGTKLGSSCPNPGSDGDGDDDFNDLVPVPPFTHFNHPGVDEKSALVMNIVLPPVTSTANRVVPIFVYVHGGSLLYGGANLPIFDAVALVSYSVDIGKPIIAVNFNYRVGLGGFLASKAIAKELELDGYHGCGNFGFTDQQVAFEWVQRYLGTLGGDIENVIAVGESAGGISISNQLSARNPPIFRRAICMSGLAASIPAWTLTQHEDLFTKTCRHFGLHPSRPDIMECLRAVPEQELADATPEIQGVLSGTGNPCLDEWFYSCDPEDFSATPEWLESFMIGDVYHEGVIFHLNIKDDSYDFLKSTLCDYVGNEDVVQTILDLYGIYSDLPQANLIQRVEHMCGDAVFKIPNYVTARCNEKLRSQGKLFLYHFDQRSRIRNTFEGTAYHAHELLYLFQNLKADMNEQERGMCDNLSRAWIDFAYGHEPWDASKDRWEWKVWGPDCLQEVRTEAEDEEVRSYSRFEKMLAIGDAGVSWKKWLLGVDAIVNKRM